MLQIYNTLTRKKEEFKPIHDNNTVYMYSCGPTVYSYAHIGNLRTYVFMDLLRRVLKYDGYKIKGVMNITDVGHLLSDGDEGEDKMQKAAREQKKSPWEIAAYYTDVFFKDLAALNIDKPEIIAKATEHIPEMIEFVKALQEKGFAYEISDGIYYDVQKFPEYGKLSGQNIDDKEAGARVEENTEKHHPADFALWKKADKNHIMQWDSPWGMGFPGWHIECSAMSRKYLGEVFDIHTGGIDAVPVHHENEIAQNEARAGKKTVNYWVHGEFMMVDGGKMSKSLGNIYTIAQLNEKGYDALDFRFLCLNAIYRNKLNFTFEGMDSAKKSRAKLMAQLYQHKISNTETSREVLDKYKNQFIDAINDDLNIPLALGVLFSMLKEPKSKDIYALALDFDRVFGLGFDKVKAPEQEPAQIDYPQEVADLIEARKEAKKNKDFAKADEIRNKITELGYSILDTREGVKVTKL